MITDATELTKLYKTAQIAKQQGATAQQIGDFLQSKGASWNDIAAVQEYGADNVARARAGSQDAKRVAESQHTPLEHAADVTADFFGKTGVGRGIAATLQGANKGNPVLWLGGLAFPGITNNVIVPQNGMERALELGAEYATPAGVVAKGTRAIVNAPRVANALGKSKVGRVVSALLTPSATPIEYASAAGAGALTGAVDPESAYGKVLTALGGGIAGGAATGVLNAFGPGNIRNFIGRASLRDELTNAVTGKKVSDVDFGRVTESTKEQINNVPGLADIAHIKDGRLVITAETIDKLAKKRINPSTPINKFVDIANDVFYGKNNQALQSGNPNSVMMVNGAGDGYGILVPNINQTGVNKISTVINATKNKVDKTIARNANKSNSRLDGLDSPSSPVQTNGASDSRFSGLQSAGSNIINPNTADVKNILSPRQTKMLAEHVGGEDILQNLISDARARGVSLAELSDPNIATMITKANLTSPTARRSIIDAQSKRVGTAAAEREKVFADTLGQRVGIQDIDNLKTEARKGASQLYNKAWKHELSGKDMLELNNNSLIRDAVNDVNKNPGLVFGGRAKIEPQSVQYWDGVKRALDDRISRLYKDGVATDPEKVAHLVEARSELVKKLDSIAPTYRYARDTYSSGYDIDNAYDLGKKVLWNNDTTDFITRVKDVQRNTTNNNAFKMGLRQAIEEKIGSARGDNVFKDVLTPNAQKKIKALIGDKEGQKLIDFAEKQFNWKQTINKALLGSPTAEKLNLAEEAVGPVTSLAKGNVLNAAGQIVGKALQKGAKAIGRATDDTNYNAIVRAIMNPARDIQITPSRTLAARDSAVRVLRNVPSAVPVNPQVMAIINALNGNK